ncbi:hypothetical protein ABK040_008205 [Willaertia magna]
MFTLRNAHPTTKRFFHINLVNQQERIVIVGGGAAGLMSTIFVQETAKKKKKEVEILLLERKSQCGKKILMSGGSRCNVICHESKWVFNHNEIKSKSDTELGKLVQKRYFTTKPEPLAKILSSWSIKSQKEFFEKDLKIKLDLEEETGKYFPISNDAKDVLNSLLRKIQTHSISCNIKTNSNVVGLEKVNLNEENKTQWKITCENNDNIICDKIIIATGGLSVINQDGTGINLLHQLGHKIIPLYPALTPLHSIKENKEKHKELSGVTMPKVKISVMNKSDSVLYQSTEANGFLFTHTGYSGPSILNSSHATILGNEMLNHKEKQINNEEKQVKAKVDLRKDSIEHLLSLPLNQLESSNRHLETILLVNWTPDISSQEWNNILIQSKQGGTKTMVKNFIHKNSEPNFLPIRIIQLILQELGDIPVSNLTKEQRNEIVKKLTKFELSIGGNGGFKKAEVTGGGVDLDCIHLNSLESKIHENLFICGEALDAFGCIGGFNFAFAWITGRLAGIASVSK